MKAYKQASIPSGSIEVRFRGSKNKEGHLAAKFIVPESWAAEAMIHLAKAPKVKGTKRVKFS